MRRQADAQARDREAWLLTNTAGPLAVGLADAAHAFVDSEGWALLGFARLGDFAREKLDRCGRWVTELAALGKRMQAAPQLRAALLGADGEAPLLLSAALEIAKTSTIGPIEEWIDLARRVTVRELKEARRTNGASAGSSVVAGDGARDAVRPGDAADEEPGAADDGVGTDPDDIEAYDDPEALATNGVQVRIPVPRAIRGCFYETLDLHRAVCGMDATVLSFIEALAAEAAAGLNPPDASTITLRRGIPAAWEEQVLARINDCWRALRSGTAPFILPYRAPEKPLAPAPHRASREEDARDAAMIAACRPAGFHDAKATPTSEKVRAAAKSAHQLTFLIHVQNRVERELGEILLEMSLHGDWTTLGFRCVGHYARERLGMPQRTAENRVSVARKLRRLPVVRAAYETGRIGREAAKIIANFLPGRAEKPQQEQWVAHAEHCTVKRLRDELQMLEYAACGEDGPAGAAGPGRSGERDVAAPDRSAASSEPEAEFPHRPPTDKEWHQSLHRAPGRTRRRLQRSMPMWEESTPTSQLDSANVFLSCRVPPDLARSFLASLEGARQQLQALAPDPAPGQPERLSQQIARAFLARYRRVPAWVALLALLEDYALTWDDPAAFPKRRWHLTYVRDGWRCMAPGCTSRQRMDSHHIHYRSHQGSNELWNLLTLCVYHHQQGEHGGYAQVRGQAPNGVLWRLGAPGIGEWYRNEMRCAA